MSGSSTSAIHLSSLLTCYHVISRYASIWQDSFFSLPIARADGTQLSHEQVIAQLNECVLLDDLCPLEFRRSDILPHLLANSLPSARPSSTSPTTEPAEPAKTCSVSRSRSNESSTLQPSPGCATSSGAASSRSIGAHSQPHRLNELVELNISTILGFLRSLEVSVAKLRQELPQRKRDGDTVSQSISRSLIFDEELSTGTSNGLLRQITFLPELARRIKEEPESVVKDLEEFRAESV